MGYDIVSIEIFFGSLVSQASKIINRRSHGQDETDEIQWGWT